VKELKLSVFENVVAFRALVLVPRPKNTEVKNSLSEQARLQKRS
jgi:hypothetical protein